MKAKICREPSCNTLIQQSEIYCSKHKREKIPFQNAIRSNEGFYNTSRWRQLRKQILSKQPYCNKCGSDVNLQIHHITEPRGNEELFFDENNLITICDKCHRIITQKEISRRVNLNK